RGRSGTTVRRHRPRRGRTRRGARACPAAPIGRRGVAASVSPNPWRALRARGRSRSRRIHRAGFVGGTTPGQCTPEVHGSVLDFGPRATGGAASASCERSVGEQHALLADVLEGDGGLGPLPGAGDRDDHTLAPLLVEDRVAL